MTFQVRLIPVTVPKLNTLKAALRQTKGIIVDEALDFYAQHKGIELPQGEICGGETSNDSSRRLASPKRTREVLRGGGKSAIRTSSVS